MTQEKIVLKLHDKPLAALPLTSYRYMGKYGYIMIGACSDSDALREAQRCDGNASRARLEVWNGTMYVKA